MDVQIATISPISVARIEHKGPYEQLASEFERLWSWVESHRVPAQRTIGVYFDNPDFVAQSQLRSWACVEIPTGYQVTNVGALPITGGTILGGTYGTTRFEGPYERLAPVWSALTAHIENALKRTIRQDLPAFEVYVNDSSETPPEQLITELYMPVV
jgi:AraC family transcriptional regulator